jgi:hypothetical protein
LKLILSVEGWGRVTGRVEGSLFEGRSFDFLIPEVRFGDITPIAPIGSFKSEPEISGEHFFRT